MNCLKSMALIRDGKSRELFFWCLDLYFRCYDPSTELAHMVGPSLMLIWNKGGTTARSSAPNPRAIVSTATAALRYLDNGLGMPFSRTSSARSLMWRVTPTRFHRPTSHSSIIASNSSGPCAERQSLIALGDDLSFSSPTLDAVSYG